MNLRFFKNVDLLSIFSIRQKVFQNCVPSLWLLHLRQNDCRSNVYFRLSGPLLTENIMLIFLNSKSRFRFFWKSWSHFEVFVVDIFDPPPPPSGSCCEQGYNIWYQCVGATEGIPVSPGGGGYTIRGCTGW